MLVPDREVAARLAGLRRAGVDLERRLRETDNPWIREDLSRYQSDRPCHVCRGARLKPEALAVKVAGLNIAESSDLSIRKAMEWFAGVYDQLNVGAIAVGSAVAAPVAGWLGPGAAMGGLALMCAGVQVAVACRRAPAVGSVPAQRDAAQVRVAAG